MSKKLSIAFLIVMLMLLLIPTVAFAHNGVFHPPAPTIEWCNTTENYNLWLYWYNLDHCPARVDPYKTWRWAFAYLLVIDLSTVIWMFMPKKEDK